MQPAQEKRIDLGLTVIIPPSDLASWAVGAQEKTIIYPLWDMALRSSAATYLRAARSWWIVELIWTTRPARCIIHQHQTLSGREAKAFSLVLRMRFVPSPLPFFGNLEHDCGRVLSGAIGLALDYPVATTQKCLLNLVAFVRQHFGFLQSLTTGSQS